MMGPTEAMLEHSSGKIVNLVSNDINSIAFNVPGISWALLDTASNFALLPFFLYRLVGTAFLYAFSMWVVLAPASFYVGSAVLHGIRAKMARCDDASPLLPPSPTLPFSR